MEPVSLACPNNFIGIIVYPLPDAKQHIQNPEWGQQAEGYNDVHVFHLK